MLASSVAAMDSRLKAWNDGGWGGVSARGATEVAEGDLQVAQRRYCLTIAGFATELTPPSVVLGLDPRTHARPLGCSSLWQTHSLWFGGVLYRARHP